MPEKLRSSVTTGWLVLHRFPECGFRRHRRAYCPFSQRFFNPDKVLRSGLWRDSRGIYDRPGDERIRAVVLRRKNGMFSTRELGLPKGKVIKSVGHHPLLFRC
jgi:hypothetical protein